MKRTNDNWVTTSQAARLIGFHPDYVRRLILSGKIKATKLGRNWVIRESILGKVKRQRFPRTVKKDLTNGTPGNGE